MCLDAPVDGLDFMMSPLLKVRGVGKKGFSSVVNGLTGMDLGNRCSQEWQKRLVKVKQEHGIKGQCHVLLVNNAWHDRKTLRPEHSPFCSPSSLRHH
jgi:hypothetical protein